MATWALALKWLRVPRMPQTDPADFDAALQQVLVPGESAAPHDQLFAQVLLDLRQRLADLEARLRRLR
ncbi:MAG: hypothetical protein ACJ8DC_01890 [Gemmatimonadales bacterium]